MALKAAILRQEGKLLLQTGYNVLLVKLLYTLPEKERVYRDENKTWYIDPKHEQTIINWLQRFGYMITDVDAAIPAGDDSFAILGLLQTATWEVCEAAYKALVKANHPDIGGNPEIMKQINAAWDRIKLSKGKN
jgi:hypothetical protein